MSVPGEPVEFENVIATLAPRLQNPNARIRIFCEGELTRSASAPRRQSVTCREFADFMMDYLSDELSTESRAAFEYHVGLCSNCRRYLASYRETVRLGKRAFED